MMSLISLIRNGYKRDQDGNWSRLFQFPRQNGDNRNCHVERIVRNSAGEIIRVDRMNKKKGLESLPENE